jgi:hypothetical protein
LRLGIGGSMRRAKATANAVLVMQEQKREQEQWHSRLKGAGGLGDAGFVGVLRLCCASLRMTAFGWLNNVS